MTTRAAASVRRESLLAVLARHGDRGATARELIDETGRREQEVHADLYALFDRLWRRLETDGRSRWRWGVAGDPIASGRDAGCPAGTAARP